MTLFYIFLFVVLAFIFFLFKKRKTGLCLAGIAIVLFLLVGGDIVPALCLNALQKPILNIPSPSWKQKNVIILLGAGVTRTPDDQKIIPFLLAYSRIYKTAELYFSCRKALKNCMIIVSGGDPLQVEASEAATYKKALINLGIRDSDIALESQSRNTFQNAEFTSILLKKEQFDQIVLVSAAIHLKRALLYFSHFGVYPWPVFADYLTPNLSMIPSAYNIIITEMAMHEFLGIAQLHIYNWLGWNDK